MRYKVYTDYVLEIYRVDTSVLGTLLSFLVLTNTKFLSKLLALSYNSIQT